MLASAVNTSRWVTHPWVEDSAAEVRFGIANGPRGDWPALSEFVAALEELGYDAFWSSDHPVPSAGCWTTLAALAATTQRSASALWWPASTTRTRWSWRGPPLMLTRSAMAAWSLASASATSSTSSARWASRGAAPGSARSVRRDDRPLALPLG